MVDVVSEVDPQSDCRRRPKCDRDESSCTGTEGPLMNGSIWG